MATVLERSVWLVRPGWLSKFLVSATLLSGLFPSTLFSQFGGSVAVDPMNLPPGVAVVIEFEVTVAAVPGDSTISNQAMAAGPGLSLVSNDPDTVAAADPTLTGIALQADLSIVKADSADPVNAGAAFSYTLDVANLGPNTATSVSVVDTLPAGVGFVSASGSGWSCGESSLVVTCTRPVLSPGNAPSITIAVTAPAAGGVITNSATVSSALSDPVAGNNTASEMTTVNALADVSITKSDGSATEVPGTPVTYTIVASNAGPSAAPNVVVADDFPAILSGCSWTTAASGGATGNDDGAGDPLSDTITLPAGSSVTYTVSCSIDAAATGVLSNTATISSAVNDPDTEDQTATDIDTLTPQVDVSVTKTDGSATEVPGTGVTYTVVVANSGPSLDPSVTLADDFPSILSACSWTTVAAGGASGNDDGSGDPLSDVIALPPGSSVTYTIGCSIDGAATGSLVNTATVTPSVSDTNAGNNSATDTDTLTAQVDLSITKTDGSATEVPGTDVTYTVVAANTGPSTDPSVVVADDFPSILSACSWTTVAAGGASGNDDDSGDPLSDTVSLPAGGSVTYTITCSIDAAATGSLVNTATVTASVSDTNAGNNSATDTDTLSPEANVVVTKTDGVTSVTPGGSTTYTITVQNAGPSSIPAVTLNDPFPGDLTCSWTSLETGGASGNSDSSGAALIDLLVMPPSSQVTYTVPCTISGSATGMISNTATASTLVSDPVPGNETATDVDDVTPLDYGDAPDTSVDPGFLYPTRLADDGARHVTTSPLHLGALRDDEADGQPTAGADGDDLTTSDDEDGVVFEASLAACETVAVEVTASAAGAMLNAWIDWNRDGDWSDPGEQVATDQVLPLVGANSVDVAVPCDLVPGASFARFRLSSVGGLLPTGQAADGEVEDYAVDLVGVDFGDAPDLPLGPPWHYPTRLVDDGARHAAEGTVFLGAAIDHEADGQPTGGADGDDIAGVDDEDGVVFLGSFIPGLDVTAQITTPVADTLLQAWFDWNSDGDWDDPGEQVFADLVIADAGVTPLAVPVPITAVPDSILYARFRLTANQPAFAGLGVTGFAASGEVEDYRVQIASVADISITKSDDSAVEVPGTSVVYTLVVANGGPSADPNVLVADDFPPILSGCAWSTAAAGGATGNDDGAGDPLSDTISLPPGASVTYTVTCSIDPAATGTLSNTATATPSVFDPDAGDLTATDIDTLTPQADVGVTKTDGSTVEVPGTGVTYTVVASNAGPSTDPSVVVSDDFPPILSGCSWTSVASGGATGNDNGSGDPLSDVIALPPGSSVTYTIDCVIDPSATGSLTNTATVSASVTDPSAGNDSATDVDTLTSQADLSINKTHGGGVVVPGTSITYTVLVANFGPSSDPAALVVDDFPATLTGCSWTSVASGGATGNDDGSGDPLSDVIALPPGGSVTYTIECMVVPTALGNLFNTATVTASVTDLEPGDNSATDSGSLMPEADLGVTKTDGVTTAVPGQNVDYTIVVSSAGPSTDPNAQLFDPLPAALTCGWTAVAAGGATGASNGAGAMILDSLIMPPGSSVTYSVSCAIAPDATGTLVNTATITTSLHDLNPANDQATDSDTLTPQSDLSIVKTAMPPSVAIGGDTVFTLEVTNFGPSTATGVVITDVLPAELLPVSASGNCVEAPAGTFTCSVPDLGPGEVDGLTMITATLDAPSAENTATVTSATSESNPADNTDSVTVASDVIPPELLGVFLVDGGDGQLSDCESVGSGPSRLELRFSEAMSTSINPSAAATTSYLLYTTGPDLDFTDLSDVEGCAAAPLGDDRQIPIVQVIYTPDSPMAPQSTVTLELGSPLRSGKVRLRICGLIEDQGGNDLGPENLELEFRSDPANLLVNGRFDCAFGPTELAPWTLLPAASSAFAHDPEVDAHASPVSGSAQIMASSGTQFHLAQCVDLGSRGAFEAAPYRLSGQLFFDGTSPFTRSFEYACRPYSGLACTGTQLSGPWASAVLLSVDQAFVPFSKSYPSLPLNAQSVRCTFLLTGGPSTGAFDARLDDLELRGLGTLFSNGFESGSLAAWSAHAP